MNTYIHWVTGYPLLSAAIQFAILGALGEIAATSIVTRRLTLPGSMLQTLGKILAWALLGVIIKYGFSGMKGFTQTLIEHSLWPTAASSGLGWAFSVSLFTNLLFGPQMMFFHRLEDNLILWRRGFDGLTRAWWTLIWFWIPAHTVTFMLPRPYQIGLAAVWSVVLGVIMGLTKLHSATERSRS